MLNVALVTFAFSVSDRRCIQAIVTFVFILGITMNFICVLYD